MSSSWKQVVFDVRDGIVKRNKMVFLFLAWSAVCIYWGVWNFTSIYDFYGYDTSTADMLILMQHQWNFGIMILPAAVFIIMKCKQDSLSVQFILRYGSRKRAFGRQIMESAVYALVMPLLIAGMETLFAYMRSRQLMNWDSLDGLYYAQTGAVCRGSFLLLFLSICCMYFLKIMMVLLLLDILLWFRKYLFALWIVLVLLAGIESLDIRFFHQFFAIRYQYWEIPWRHVVIFLIGILIMAAEYIIGITMIRKNDIFK